MPAAATQIPLDLKRTTSVPYSQCTGMVFTLGAPETLGCCDSCGSLVASSLNPVRMRRIAPNVLSSCGSCLLVYVVPKIHNIARELRKLNKDIVRALRPFDVDVGNAPARRANGFRRHGGILSWSADSVTEKIERLPHSQKEVAEDAYFFLISCRRSAYKQVVRQHEGSNL